MHCHTGKVSVAGFAAFQTVPHPVFCPSGSTLALVLNFLACLARFCVDTSSGSGFGLSMLWLLLFTPCSFVCWYRPMYKAFRYVRARRGLQGVS